MIKSAFTFLRITNISIHHLFACLFLIQVRWGRREWWASAAILWLTVNKWTSAGILWMNRLASAVILCDHVNRLPALVTAAG